MKYHNFANRVSDNNKQEILMSLIDLSCPFGKRA